MSTLENNNKHKNSKRAFNYMLSFLLTIVFLYIAFYNVDFSQVLEIVSGASIPFIFLFIAVQLFSHYIRAVRWKVILNSVKPDAKTRHLFGALMVGYGVNCVVPRLGEVTRAVLMGKWENLSKSSMFGTVIVERVIDIVSLGLTVLISAYLYSDVIYVTFPWLKAAIYISFLMIAVAIAFIYLLIKYKERFYLIIIKHVNKFSVRLGEKLGHTFGMLIEGFASLKGTKNYINTFLLTILINLLYGSTTYIGFYMLNMNSEYVITFAMAWVVMSISSIGVAIPTPGGTGSYHTLAKNSLVLLYGISGTIAAAYAFLTHIISYFMFILLSVIIYFLLNKQHESLIKVIETDINKI